MKIDIKILNEIKRYRDINNYIVEQDVPPPPPPAGDLGAIPPPPGGDEGGGSMPPPPPSGPEPGGDAGVTPESFKRDNLKILLESNSLTDEDSYIDLSKGKNSLGEMETQLSKLLKD